MREALARMISEQRADVLAFLSSAGPAHWDAPTACAPWTVKDVLAHMVEGELHVGRVYRGEVVEHGFIDPEEGIAKWRALPGEAVRASFWQHGVATQRVLDAMTDEVYRAPIKIFGCRQIAQLVRLHLFDLAVHGHDLTTALDAEPVWGPRLSFLAEFVVRAAPPSLARNGLAPSDRAIAIASGGKTWRLAREGERWAVGETGPVAATLETDEADLVLVTAGRADPAEVLARARIDGDRDLVEQVVRAWRVV